MREIDQQRYVAENYHRLQGLKLVPLGLACLVLGVGGYAGWWFTEDEWLGYPNMENPDSAGIAVMAVAVTLAFALMWPIGLWYRRRYGRVEVASGERSRDRKVGIVSGIIAPLVMIWILPVLHLVDEALGTPVSLTGLALAVVLTLPTFVSRSEERFWDRPGVRKAARAAAVVVTAASLLPLFGVTESGSGIYGIAGLFLVFGCLLLATAVSDHLVLDRAMSGESNAQLDAGSGQG